MQPVNQVVPIAKMEEVRDDAKKDIAAETLCTFLDLRPGAVSNETGFYRLNREWARDQITLALAIQRALKFADLA